jgi:acyl-CoA synthetase (NDP forming)
VTVDALFRQAGVIRTDTLSELFDVARLISSQPVPRGGRIGIVTNAGGLGILCADACDAGGMEVPELPDDLRAELATFLAPTSSTVNPVDMIATATADDYRAAIRCLAASGAVDAIIAIFIPPLVTLPGDVADALRDSADELGMRLPLAVVFSSHLVPPQLTGGAAPMPVYAYPEEAARAMAKVVAYGRWRGRDHGSIPVFDDIDSDRAAAVVAEALERGSGWLTPAEVERMLGCYQLPTPAARVTGPDPDAVGAAAREIGGRVAVKAIAADLLHKTDAGAVEVGLTSRAAPPAARRIARAIAEAGHEVEGFLVQRMADPGVEMLVGTVHDPVFGAVLVCGGGGTAAEVIGDVAVRVTPVTDRDADEMLSSLRTYPLLRGYRGAAPVDIDALREVVLRLGAMVDAHPEVVEVDLNPVVASASGAVIVDARMRVEPTLPPEPWPALGR